MVDFPSNASSDSSFATATTATTTAFSQSLAEHLPGLCDRVIHEWQEEHKNHPPAMNDSLQTPSSPGVADISEIIRVYSHRNFVIGLDCPREMFSGKSWPETTVSEVFLIIAQHLQMLLDIGKAYGILDELMDREYLFSILLLSGDPANGGALLQRAGQRVCLRKPGAQLFPQVIAVYADTVAWVLGKVGSVKAFPEVAPGTLAAWGGLSSWDLGRLVQNLFAEGFSLGLPEQPKVILPEVNRSASSEEDKLCDLEKVKILINLLKDDHVPDDRKTLVISPFLKELDLPEPEAHRMEKKMADSKPFKIDLQVFHRNPCRKINLMMDLIGLTLSDLKMSSDKSRFVKEIGQSVGFSSEEMNWLLDEEVRARAFKSRLALPTI